MTMPDYAKAFTDFWAAQGDAMLKAQAEAARMVTDGMQAMASGTLPALPGAAAAGLSAEVADLGRASTAVMELWSAAAAMSGEVAGKLAADPLPVLGEMETSAVVLGRITDPRQWLSGTGEMDSIVSRMAEGPRLADLWDVERRFAQVAQAWMLVRRRQLEHEAIVLQGWMQAGRRFMEEWAGKHGAEARAPDTKATLALWTEVANRQLLDMQRSEPFLQTQRNTIRATADLRLAQQDLVEHFGKQYGFPTRTELDDVHRTVTTLRRELRAVQRALRGRTAPDGVLPVAPPTPPQALTARPQEETH